MRIERSDPITASNPGPDLISATARVQSVAPVTSNPVTPTSAPVSVTLQLTPMAQEAQKESSAVMRQGSFEASRVKAQQPTQAEKAAQSTGDPHVSLIRSMLEALTGVRVHVISGVDLGADSAAGTIPLSSESAVERVGRNVSTSASGNPSLPIVADGIIRTLDRAEIHFRLELAMRRDPSSGLIAPTEAAIAEPSAAPIELSTQAAPLPPAPQPVAVASAPESVSVQVPIPSPVQPPIQSPPPPLLDLPQPPLPPAPALEVRLPEAGAAPAEPLLDPALLEQMMGSQGQPEVVPAGVAAAAGPGQPVSPQGRSRHLPGVANFEGQSTELRSGTYVVALEVAAPQPLIADARLQTHLQPAAPGRSNRTGAHKPGQEAAPATPDERLQHQYALFELKIGTAVNTQA